MGNELPTNIVEHWRKVYIDCTNLEHNDAKIDELVAWLNAEQPISLAVNDDSWDLKQKFFESTGLVVYTFGKKSGSYALTAQARPQDGEVFGELPPRKNFDEVSRYPMLNPMPCGAWNTVFSNSYLDSHSQTTSNRRAADIVSAISDKKYKAYACLLTDYIADACAASPSTVSEDNGTSRTAYFGLQRPPIDGTKTLLSLSGGNADMLLLHLLPFAITSAFDQCVVSASENKEVSDLLGRLGIEMVNGGDNAMKFFNKVDMVKENSQFEFCLPFQFCARLLCIGHCKSTIANDKEFLAAFKDSKKWLKLRD